MCLFLGFLLLAHHNSHRIQRDPKVLMNLYFRLKHNQPEAAKQALTIILQQNHQYPPALIELSQWLIHRKAYEEAMIVLEKIRQQLPEEDKYQFQLAYLYYKTGRWQEAQAIYIAMQEKNPTTWQTMIVNALRAMGSYIPNYKDLAKVTWYTHSKPALPLDIYYRLRQNPKAPYQAYLKKIHRQFPHDIKILIELGILMIQENRLEEAIQAFKRAYAIAKDQTTALQLGYLYTSINENRTAYQYFKLASNGQDNQLAWIGENAMTRLAGQQTKSFPEPYYGEFYMMPFSQSRFGITVSQFIGRLGVEFNWLETQPRFYSFTRRTQDNKENNIGELPQLYEDNVWVTGMGTQFFPFRKIPLFIYLEGGAARDLYDRARERWRADLRTGLMYYQEFGKMPSYYGKLTYSTDYYAIWYAEMTYFSRYDNNVIASVRTHQGIRLIQYKSSMINLFVRGRVIEDTNRDFYNNFAEIGPGLGIIPSNRFNFEINLDYINGMYLPAGGREKNPYAKYYSNKRALLLFYIKV